MRNQQLEEALMNAGRANDIPSLKALARQESARADQLCQLLSAVLAVAGPIRIHGDIAHLASPGAFSVAQDGNNWIVRHENAPNRSGAAPANKGIEHDRAADVLVEQGLPPKVEPARTEEVVQLRLMLREFVDFLEPMRFGRESDNETASQLEKAALALLGK